MLATEELSFGQLSLWLNVRSLPEGRRHEANMFTVWSLPKPIAVEQVRSAFRMLIDRHSALRTTYDFTEAERPRQIRHPRGHDFSLAEMEGTSVDANRRARETALFPFDLEADVGWRATLVTHLGSVTHVVFVHHHIVADAWAQSVLGVDLCAGLEDQGDVGPAETDAVGPMDLAVEQRSPASTARSVAAVKNWRRISQVSHDLNTVQRSGTAEGRGTEPALQASLRSARMPEAAAIVAERWGVSRASAVLTAYVMTVAEQQGLRTLPVRLLSSNRFNARWERLVTTMNQWAPVAIEVPSTAGFAETVRSVHRSAMQAYRLGMYDPKAVAALRSELAEGGSHAETGWSFNYVISRSIGDQILGALDSPVSDPPELLWEKPFHTIGTRYYLRTYDLGSEAWTVRLTGRDVSRESVVGILTGTYALLMAQAST